MVGGLQRDPYHPPLLLGLTVASLTRRSHNAELGVINGADKDTNQDVDFCHPAFLIADKDAQLIRARRGERKVYVSQT